MKRSLLFFVILINMLTFVSCSKTIADGNDRLKEIQETVIFDEVRFDTGESSWSKGVASVEFIDNYAFITTDDGMTFLVDKSKCIFIKYNDK